MVVIIRSEGRLGPPSLWNVHQATLNNEPRTNNQCEGWNNRFKSLIGQNHPSVWTLIEALKREESIVSTQIAKDLNGEPPKKRDVNTKICRFVYTIFVKIIQKGERLFQSSYAE